MRGRTVLLVIAFAAALALLLISRFPPQHRTGADEVREPARPVQTASPKPTPPPAAAEQAVPAAPNPTTTDVSLRPAPEHTGVEPDGTLSAGTLLMGDSLTAGLAASMLAHETLGAAHYIGIPSYSLQNFYTMPYYIGPDAAAAGLTPVCSPELYGLSLAQAAQTEGRRVEAIYFMLGTNLSAQVTAEEYTSVLKYLLDCCPNATIFAETIPYSRGGFSDYTHVNAIICEVVTELHREGIERVFVLDSFTAIGSDCNMPDGIHLTDAGLVAWRDAIVDNALKIF